MPLEDRDGTLSEHFGNAPLFALATVRRADGEIEEQRVLGNPHRTLEKAKGIRVAEWLLAQKVDALLLRSEVQGKGPEYVLRDAGVTIVHTDERALSEALAHAAPTPSPTLAARGHRATLGEAGVARLAAARATARRGSMLVDDLVQRNVMNVTPDCTLREAARRMAMHSVGAMVVAETRSSPPLGVVTDRDLVTRIGYGADPERTTVAEVMKAPVHIVAEGTSLGTVSEKMRRHGVRRLPVVDERGNLVGIVTLDDVFRFLARELADLARAIDVQLEHEHPVPSAHDRSL
ncbi:MAG: CBS domain-containing protein [Thermodesulfobacteriota bacterium]